KNLFPSQQEMTQSPLEHQQNIVSGIRLEKESLMYI
ncbi:uncharacterized protein METZ01_LOCUS457085, partial [marine metagenome]